jgi:hypothetical protein
MIEKNTDPTVTGAGRTVLPAETEQRLKNDAGALVDAAKSELSQLKTEAETQAGALAEEAKAEFGKVAEKAKGLASEQKDMIADQVDGVAQAVSKVAGELEASDATTAGYARTVADSVNKFSETLKTKDVDQLLQMAEDFGRKQPAAFAGVMAIAGFAASRFLLASAQRREETDASKPVTYGDSSYAADRTATPTYGNSSPSTPPAGGRNMGGSL